jgi:UDP-glucuronate 4-epimerase
MAFSYHNMFELDINILRFFTVYGPRGRPDMMAYKIADSIRSGDEVPLYNGGQMYRDWTYVEDTVRGIVAAADHRLGYEIFNLGRGESTLLSDFIKLVEERFGRHANLRPSAMPMGDIQRTIANIDKARKILGYNPQVGVSDGVETFADWYESVHS